MGPTHKYRSRFSLVLAVFALFVAKATRADGSPPYHRPTFLFIGDSMTEGGGWITPSIGWEMLIRESYLRSADVLNRGLSGYNTRLFLKYALPGIAKELTTKLSPDFIAVWFGVNDATLSDGPNSAQHVELDEYKENLVAIVREFRQLAPDAKILFMSPVYIDDNQRRQAQKTPNSPPDRSNVETAKYAAVCVEVAAEVERQDIAFLNLFDYFSTTYPTDADKAKLLRDGIHLTDEGNRIVFNLLRQRSRNYYPVH